MPFICRTLPAAWPLYIDLDGHQWRLAPNDYWWLHWGEQWHQAASVPAGDVLGVKVPPAILRANKSWLASAEQTPGRIRVRADYENLMAHHERQIARSFTIALPPASKKCKPAPSRKDGPPLSSGTGVLTASPARNIPPDFREIPAGPGCCRGCRLNDLPLWENDLCRYCWMLAQVATPRPAPAAEQPRQQRRRCDPRYVATTAIAAVILLLAVYVAVVS